MFRGGREKIQLELGTVETELFCKKNCSGKDAPNRKFIVIMRLKILD